MRFQLQPGSFVDRQTDAVIVPVGRDRTLSETAGAFDQALDGALSRALDDAQFSGAVGKTLVIPTLGRLPARRLVATGTGQAGSETAQDIRRAWGLAARAARDAGARDLTSPTPSASILGLTAALQAAVEGVTLACYRFLDYRTLERPTTDLETVTFLGDSADAQRGIERGERVAAGVTLARDLVNRPPDTLSPVELARIAQQIAEQNGLECKIFDRQGLESIEARCILAVGQGSRHEPRLIHLTYRPTGESQATIGLVGKAITFDSGGLNIKPGDSMLTMKMDMAGGAAVLGAMSVVGALDLPFTVHGVVASAENMLDGAAFRPSDVLRAMNGKTIEIVSTDAEGRLVLADALTYSARAGADLLIDLATLTGAAVVALGKEGTALFGNDQQLVDELRTAGEWNGEKLWPMPLWPDYRKSIDGDVADIKNSGGRAGGSIMGALFLQEFTEGLPWAHLDIAGPAWSDGNGDLTVKGGTGHGVRTLLTFLERRAGG